MVIGKERGRKVEDPPNLLLLYLFPVVERDWQKTWAYVVVVEIVVERARKAPGRQLTKAAVDWIA